MPSSTTQTTIVSRALQLLGQPPVNSIQDNSSGARAMNRAWTPVLLAMLRQNYWGFSIKRVQIAEDAVAPLFVKGHRYKVPGDFISLAPPDDDDTSRVRDWKLEGGYIITNDKAPLNVRYVSSDVTTDLFDPLFAEALSACLAMETCEQITNSNTKLQNIMGVYKATMEQAQKMNAFENRPVVPAPSSWISMRS